MQNHRRNVPDEKSLTSGLYNKFSIAFWGLLLLGAVAGLGQGSLMLNIARLALIGMAAMLTARAYKPPKVSFKIFAIAEVLLLAILIGSGLIAGNGWIVALGVLIVAFVVLATFIIRFDRRLGLRT